MKTKQIIILSVLFFTLIFTVSAGWWDTDWGYRRKLTLDNSQQSNDLDNFTVLIVLNTTNFDFSKINNDGSDLRFIDADNSTNLSWHIDHWDTTDTSYLWVKVPNIPSSDNTDNIYIYYNNSGASDNQDEAGTYDQFFVAVYHLNESSGTVYDSTGSHHLTNNDAKYNTTSYIGGGYYVDTNNDYLYTADAAIFDNVNHTIEAMINFISAGDDLIACVVDKRDSAEDGWAFRKSLSNDAELKANTQETPTAPAVTYGQWYYFVGSKDPDRIRIYYDARYRGVTVSSQTFDTTQDLAIGNNAYHYANPGYSSFDEIRISSIKREWWWINASWRSVTNQFVSIGSEESAPAASASMTLYSSLVNATKNYNTQTLNFTYNATFVSHSTTLGNCSFYQQEVFNQTLLNVDLSNNNVYNITFPIDYVGIYNISFNCTSLTINDTFDQVYYFVDLLAPVIESSQNNVAEANNTQYIGNTSVTFYFNVTDDNLLQWTSTFFDVNDNVWQGLNLTLTNITTTFSENSTTLTLNETGNFSHFIEAYDSHTGNIITNYSWEKYSVNISGTIYKGISFANNKFNMSTDDYQYLEDWELFKDTDRYMVNMTFNQTGFWMDIFYQSSKPMQKIDWSGYQGHLIVGKNHWIDHVPENNDSIENFTLTWKPNYNAYRARFYVKNESVVFHSVGVLNYNSREYNFEVLPHSYPVFTDCKLNSSTTLDCFDTVVLSCNVTSDYTLTGTNFTIDGVTYTASNITGTNTFVYNISSTVENSSKVFAWTTARSCNNWGDCTTENVNIDVNYSCNYSQYINIQNVQAINIGKTNATITWTTSHLSDSNVTYDTTSEKIGNLVTSHTVTLYGLTDNTFYNFNVTSTKSPVTQTLTDYNFTTKEIISGGGGGGSSGFCGDNKCGTYETEENCPEDCLITPPDDQDLTISHIDKNYIWFTVDTDKTIYEPGEDIDFTVKTYINNKPEDAFRVTMAITKEGLEYGRFTLYKEDKGVYLFNYPNILKEGDYDFVFNVEKNRYETTATRAIKISDQAEVLNYVFEPSGKIKVWVYVTTIAILSITFIIIIILIMKRKKKKK